MVPANSFFVKNFGNFDVWLFKTWNTIYNGLSVKALPALGVQPKSSSYEMAGETIAYILTYFRTPQADLRANCNLGYLGNQCCIAMKQLQCLYSEQECARKHLKLSLLMTISAAKSPSNFLHLRFSFLPLSLHIIKQIYSRPHLWQ